MDYNINYQQRLAMLTPRESEIAELLAWGASKKEIPDLLTIPGGQPPISVHTVVIIAEVGLSSSFPILQKYTSL